MDLTKEVRGNEPPAETKRKVAKERRKEDERGGRTEGEGGGRRKRRRAKKASVRSREEHDDAGEGKRRTEGEREGWKGEGIGCGRAFEASRRA